MTLIKIELTKGDREKILKDNLDSINALCLINELKNHNRVKLFKLNEKQLKVDYGSWNQALIFEGNNKEIDYLFQYLPKQLLN